MRLRLTAAQGPTWKKALGLACGLLASTGLAPAQVFAQEAPSTPSGAAPAAEAEQGETQTEVQAPVLQQFAAAEFPAQALSQGRSAQVLLKLDIDAQGTVTQAEVQQAAGYGFDEAAVAAALRFRFTPARRNGVPVPARILYRYVFEPPPVQAVEQLASYAGRVLSAQGGPLPAVQVQLRRGEQLLYATLTDAQGKFVFINLAPGELQLQAHKSGYEPYQGHDRVLAGEQREVQFALEPVPLASEQDTVSVTVLGTRKQHPTLVRSMKAKEMRRVPGTFGDALRSLQSLPGVARTPTLSGLLVVRGTGPESSQVFFEGVLTPQVYHFGGLSSVVPTEMLESIEFRPGNFPVRYGRGIGGIVEAKLRHSQADERVHGLAQVDFIDARVMLEAPIGGGYHVLAGGRRSHLDAWLGNVLQGTNTSFNSLPVYYDYQLFVDRELAQDGYFRIGVFGADDRMSLISDSSVFLSRFRQGRAFWNVISQYQAQLSANTRWEQVSSFGRLVEHITVGPLFSDTYAYPMVFRGELTHTLSESFTLRAGPDVAYAPFTLQFQVTEEDPTTQPRANSPLLDPPRMATTQAAFLQPAAFAELTYAPRPSLQLTGGVRLDYTRETQMLDFAPRLNAQWAVAPEYPKTVLRAAAGVFYEPQEVRFTLPEYGSSSLRSQRSLQAALGVTQDLSQQLELGVDAFVSGLDHLLSFGPSANGPAAYNTAASGDVVGTEVLLRYNPDAVFFGWLSYTLSRSMRRFADGAPRDLFLGDQTHIGSLLGSFRLGAGWEVGGRFRLVSGDLYQPCGQFLLSTSDGGGLCLPAGRSLERTPLFHQLDLRVEKEWALGDRARLSAYADVINVYNREQADLPFVPSLGLRGEL